MATYRGQDGSVSVGGTNVGEVVSWSLNVTRDIMEDTVMLDTAKTFKAGLNEWDATVTVRLDYGDAEQKAFVDDIIASSAATYALELNVDGTKNFAGSAVVTGFNPTASLDSIIQGDFSFKSAGPLSVAWV